MNKSEHIDQLTKALVEVQKELKPVYKNATNPFFKSTYANHEAVYLASVEMLTKHGLAISQGMDFVGNMWAVETVLVHESGQWISSLHPCEPVKKDPQGYASANTYGRRIGHMGVIGMVATDDDDGNGTLRGEPHPDQDKAVKEISTLLKKLGKPESDFVKHLHTVCKRTDIESFYDLDRAETETAITLLKSIKPKSNGAANANGSASK